MRYVLKPLVGWYLTYPLSKKNIEELAEKRGIRVKLSNSTINWYRRWWFNNKPIKLSAPGEWVINKRRIKIKRQWKFLYTLTDPEKNIIDFVIFEQDDKLAAKKFFSESLSPEGVPIEIHNYIAKLKR